MRRIALVTANLRWLAGYRHPRHHLPGTVEVLRRVFATPMPLMAGAEAAGDPIAVLPVLFHLLWYHELTIDLSTPLHQATLVGTVNLSNPRAIFAGSPPRFTRSRVTYEAYVVSRTSTRPQVDSAV